MLLAAFSLPALAVSSASSEVSDSIGQSVGSSSTSIQKSSDSSSGKDDKKVTDGDYRIIEVAAAPARDNTVRLKLQALATGGQEGEFFLYMPQAAFDQSRLGVGHIVTARTRTYGIEFTQGQPQQPFFLVLEDAVYRELQTKVVQL